MLLYCVKSNILEQNWLNWIWVFPQKKPHLKQSEENFFFFSPILVFRLTGSFWLTERSKKDKYRWIYQVDSVQDADPQSHERFGEINHLLSLWGDSEASGCQVCFLQWDKQIWTDNKSKYGYFSWRGTLDPQCLEQNGKRTIKHVFFFIVYKWNNWEKGLHFCLCENKQ